MINVLKTIRFKIGSALGGWSSSWFNSQENEFLDSVGIDPEYKYGDGMKAFGAIYPPLIGTVSVGDGLKTAPMWITGAQTTTGIFVYGANGTLFTYDGSMAFADTNGGGLLNTGGAGNGQVSAGDYLYLATGTGVSRLGPLSATAPTLLTTFWTTAITGEGLGLSALTNTTYPSSNSVTYPNHPMHFHNDGYVYVADYASNQGMIHSFYSGTSATSATYSDLLLPPGLLPVDIKSYGTDLAILCCASGLYGGGATPRAGRSALVLWDTVSPNFYRSVPISEPWATALVNKNGELFVLVGTQDRGVKLMKYLGEDSVQILTNFLESSPPPAGAADSLGNMVVWGISGSVPTTYAGVMSYGFRGMSGTPVNNIMRISDTTGSLPRVSALKFVKSTSLYPVVGWMTNDSTYGLDAEGSGTLASVFRTRVFNVGSKFNIKRIRIPLTGPIASGMSISPKIYIDNTTSYELPDINPTNYPNSERIIDYTNLAVGGFENFYIQFTGAGTVQLGFSPEATIDVELYD